MTREEFEVVVVGGGPAGSLTAALLAIKGRRVLLLESESFPRYHIGESFVTGLIPVLEEAGVDLDLIDREFRPKTGLFLVWGKDHDMWRTPFSMAKVSHSHAWHVDRAHFDKILLDNARERGATVRENAKVVRTLDSDGRVTGVVYVDERGEHEVAAAMTVDASGQARAVARHYTNVTFHDDLKNVALWSYFDFQRHSEETEYDIVVEALQERRWTWMIPIRDHYASLGLVMPVDLLAKCRKEGQSATDVFLAAVRDTRATRGMVKDLEETVARTGLRTTRDWSHVTNRWFGPGWLAIGDSAAFIDPLFSFGVFLAASGAYLGARAIDAFLDVPDEAAFRNFQRIYTALVDDMLQFVRFFYDSSRTREDYQQRASEHARVRASSSQVGFITLLAGVSRLPEVINFEPMGPEGMLAAKRYLEGTDSLNAAPL